MTVGGGVEANDATIEAALYREVFEELVGKLERAELVHLLTDELEGGVGVQHIFAARLESMDLAARTGTEFAKPERGGYDVVRVPFTAKAVRELNLMPPKLAEFIAANTDAIVSVLDTPIREAWAMTQAPEFVSLNGPDNVGKTTHLVRLTELWDGFQPLGAGRRLRPVVVRDGHDRRADRDTARRPRQAGRRPRGRAYGPARPGPTHAFSPWPPQNAWSRTG